MKQLLPISMIIILSVIGCSRKSIPQKTNNVKVHSAPVIKAPENKTIITEPSLIKEKKIEKEDRAEPKVEKKEELLPMIVIDGMGNIITPQEKLPEEIATKLDYRVLSRAFTPNQRTNLIYRYKIVPPRILFVPENYIKTSARGKYVVYRKKFWYWQKEDGLFYLDETYYN